MSPTSPATIEALAELTAHLADPFADRGAVLSKAGLDEGGYGALARQLCDRLQRDGADELEMAARFARAFEKARGEARNERVGAVGAMGADGGAIVDSTRGRASPARFDPIAAFRADAESTCTAIPTLGPAMPFRWAVDGTASAPAPRPSPPPQWPSPSDANADQTAEIAVVAAGPATPFERGDRGEEAADVEGTCEMPVLRSR